MTDENQAPEQSEKKSQPVSTDKDANQWAMFLHFSLLVGFLIPLAGLVVPIIIWQIKKDQYSIIDVHGKIVVNWIISALIYFVACVILSVIVIGTIGLVVLAIICIVFPVIGGIKANNGEVWEYPLSLKLIK